MGDQNLATLVSIVHAKAEEAVCHNADTGEYIRQMISLNCPLHVKYKTLDMTRLIRENSANVGELQKIAQALNILEKYARHLLKPLEYRSNMWRYVKFSNQIFKDKVDAIKGGRDIMREMGYIEDIEDGLAFPDGVPTDEARLSSLVTDFLLGKKELDVYFNKLHPNPLYIEELLPQNTIMEVRQLHACLESLTPEILAKASKIAVPLSVPPGSSQQPIVIGSQGQQLPYQHQYQQHQYVNVPTLSQRYNEQQVPYQQDFQYAQRTVKPDQQQILSHGTGTQSSGSDVGQSVTTAEQYVGQRTGSSSSTSGIMSTNISSTPTQQRTQSSSSDIGSQAPSEVQKSQSANEEAFESIVCDICGDNTAQFVCEICDNKQLCPACDKKWHKHPKRQNHQRKNLFDKTMKADSILSGGQKQSGLTFKEVSAEDNYVTARSDLLPAHIAGMRIDEYDDRGTGMGIIGGQTSDQLPVEPPVRDVIGGQTSDQSPVGPAFSRLSTQNRQQQSYSGGIGIPYSQETPQNVPAIISTPPRMGTLPSLHQGQGEPQSRSLPRTAPGGPPLSRSSSSKFLPKIMAVTDLQKRKSKAEVTLETIQEEIDEIEEKIQKLIEENPQFYEDEEYSTLFRKKGMLQREKMEVDRYMKELDGMIDASAQPEPRYRGESESSGSDISNQQIFYPPKIVPYSSVFDDTSFQAQPQSFSPVSFPHGNIYQSYVYVQQPGGQPVLMPATPTGGQHYVPVSLQPVPSQDFQSQGRFQSGHNFQQQQQHFMPYDPKSYGQPINYPGQNQVQMRNRDLESKQIIQGQGHMPQGQSVIPKTSVQGQGQMLQDQRQVPRPSIQAQGQDIQSQGQMNAQVKRRPQSQHVSMNIPPDDIENRRKTIATINLPEDEKEMMNQNAFNEFKQGHFIGESGSSLPASANQSTKITEQRNVSEGRRWICEHCTYHNGPETRVCEVCYKTSNNPQYITEEHINHKVKESTPDKSTGRSSSRSSSEETQVLEMASHVGRSIAAVHDEIYWEKKAAQKRYSEMMEEEKQKTKEGNKPQGQGEQAVPQIPPRITQTQQEQVQHTAVQQVTTRTPVKVAEPTKVQHVPSKTTKQPSPQSSPSNLKASPIAEQNQQSQVPGVIQHAKPNLNFSETMEQIQQKREHERFIIDGKELIRMIKAAEKNGFDVEEVKIAQVNCSKDQMLPLDWLTNKWQQTIDHVVTMVTNEGSRMEQNDVGELSASEAKSALKEQQGNVPATIRQCVQKRKQMYKEISSTCSYPREEILQAMLQSSGDVAEALDELNDIHLQSYIDRVWTEDSHIQQPVEGDEEARELEAAVDRAVVLSRHDTCVSVTNSVLTHTNFQQIVKSKDIDLERRIRMILVEGKLQSWGRAATVITIIDSDLEEQKLEAELEDVVEAVRNCAYRQSSLIYLQQECDCCYGKFPMSKIRSLGNCQCKLCNDCMKGNFEVTIREKHVRNLSCPLCNLPDMEDVEAASEYLSFLTMLLQTMVSQEILDLYQIKLRDWHLQKDPNFRWCSHCGNGFIWGIGTQRLGMQCPMCNKKTCFLCKKQWEDQHEGLTCEEFNQWKIDNDPNNQAAGLAKHLELNGIDCPSCKMSYSLAKGGCMHFKCPQCGHEFCSGCSQPFDSKGMCTKFASCRGKGLHCHHPRDCFYYLRDNDVDELQKLLQDNKIAVDKNIPDNQEDKQHCPVMEQKDFGEGRQDEACGKDIVQGHAGLCLIHYKEYLVGLINKHKIDPVAMMKIEDMVRLLEREEKHVTQRKQQETDAQYRKRLKHSIKDKIPLKR